MMPVMTQVLGGAGAELRRRTTTEQDRVTRGDTAEERTPPRMDGWMGQMDGRCDLTAGRRSGRAAQGVVRAMERWSEAPWHVCGR